MNLAWGLIKSNLVGRQGASGSSMRGFGARAQSCSTWRCSSCRCSCVRAASSSMSWARGRRLWCHCRGFLLLLDLFFLTGDAFTLTNMLNLKFKLTINKYEKENLSGYNPGPPSPDVHHVQEASGGHSAGSTQGCGGIGTGRRPPPLPFMLPPRPFLPPPYPPEAFHPFLVR